MVGNEGFLLILVLFTGMISIVIGNRNRFFNAVREIGFVMEFLPYPAKKVTET